MHAGCSLLDAQAVEVSAASDHFRSKAFQGYRKSVEAKQKLDVAVADRLNGVITAIGFLGRALSRRR